MAANELDVVDDEIVDAFDSAPSREITDEEYKKATGEYLHETVDLSSWKRGIEALQDHQKLESEIAAGEAASADLRAEVRRTIFPIIPTLTGAPPCAGVYKCKTADVEQVQRDLLMRGKVEGCDANVHVINSLALQVIQIAVVGASYNGEEEAWAHRIFKRDIKVEPGANMVEIALDLLTRRSPDDTTKPKPKVVSDMMRRGVMTLMERQVLADALRAPWRIGHGNPLAYELLTGSGSAKLISLSLPVLRRIIEHKKFIYVPSDTTELDIKTIGDALEPFEYAIIKDTRAYLKRISEGHFRGEWALTMQRELRGFIDDVAEQVVIGAYRASRFAPAQVFYAHRDHAHEAACIAIADSCMLDHRGFPMLIEMADNFCRTYFSSQTLERPAYAAFAAADAPYRHLEERATRR